MSELQTMQKQATDNPQSLASKQAYINALESHNRELLAVNQVLREALQMLYDNQNGCPLPKYEADWNEAMDMTAKSLAIKPGDIALVEVGSMQNDMRTGHSYNILFNDGMHQPIGTKLYALQKKEGK